MCVCVFAHVLLEPKLVRSNECQINQQLIARSQTFTSAPSPHSQLGYAALYVQPLHGPADQHRTLTMGDAGGLFPQRYVYYLVLKQVLQDVRVGVGELRGGMRASGGRVTGESMRVRGLG